MSFSFTVLPPEDPLRRWEPCESCGQDVGYLPVSRAMIERPLGLGPVRPMPLHTPERCRSSRGGDRPPVEFHYDAEHGCSWDPALYPRRVSDVTEGEATGR